jgi:hypothetical protein
VSAGLDGVVEEEGKARSSREWKQRGIEPLV